VWLKNQLAAERREIEQTAQSGQGFLGKKEQAGAAFGGAGWGRQ